MGGGGVGVSDNDEEDDNFDDDDAPSDELSLSVLRSKRDCKKKQKKRAAYLDRRVGPGSAMLTEMRQSLISGMR